MTDQELILDKWGYIYKITNLTTGAVYVGVHKTIPGEPWERYLGSGTQIRRAIQKDGRGNFKKELLETVSEEEARDAERRHIALARQGDAYCYNISLGNGRSANYQPMQFHYNPEVGRYLECRSTKGQCPFGNGADKTVPEIVQEAAKAVTNGEPLPIIKDSSNDRFLSLNEDGTFRLGARNYDRQGVLIPSDRTLKKRRLADWAFFKTATVEQKLEKVGGNLIAYELSMGHLKKRRVSFQQFEEYAEEHHEGSFRKFFNSIWSTVQAPTLLKRYTQTLEEMLRRVVRRWLGL